MNIAFAVELTLGRRMRNARQQMRRVGWLFRLVGVGYAVWAIQARDMVLLILALFLLLMPEVIAVLRHLRGKKYGRVYTYTLTDEVLRVTTAVSSLELVWDAVKTVRESSTSWNLRIAGGAGMTLPKDGFRPEQDLEWRAFLTARELVRT
jgi:hypothetical protein